MKKKDWQVLIVVLIVILTVITTVIASSTYFNVRYGSNDDYWEYLYNQLEDEYNVLYNSYSELEESYDTLNDYYEELSNEYEESLTPLISIKNRTIWWRFNLLDNSLLSWSLDMETYIYYISKSDPIETHRLKNTENDEIYTVTDLREYVTPDMFSKIISTLTSGNSAKEFVAEIVNIKNQLISYSSGLNGEYRWAVETITEGTGNCGDMSILIANLLKAGENEADYGLKIYFWYCDAGNMTEPQEVNHVIVEVEYSDDDSILIEPTSNMFYTYNQIKGWKFEV